MAPVQPVQRGRSVNDIAWLSDAERVVVGIAEHRVCDNHQIVT